VAFVLDYSAPAAYGSAGILAGTADRNRFLKQFGLQEQEFGLRQKQVDQDFSLRQAAMFNEEQHRQRQFEFAQQQYQDQLAQQEIQNRRLDDEYRLKQSLQNRTLDLRDKGIDAGMYRADATNASRESIAALRDATARDRLNMQDDHFEQTLGFKRDQLDSLDQYRTSMDANRRANLESQIAARLANARSRDEANSIRRDYYRMLHEDRMTSEANRNYRYTDGQNRTDDRFNRRMDERTDDRAEDATFTNELKEWDRIVAERKTNDAYWRAYGPQGYNKLDEATKARWLENEKKFLAGPPKKMVSRERAAPAVLPPSVMPPAAAPAAPAVAPAAPAPAVAPAAAPRVAPASVPPTAPGAMPPPMVPSSMTPPTAAPASSLPPAAVAAVAPESLPPKAEEILENIGLIPPARPIPPGAAVVPQELALQQTQSLRGNAPEALKILYAQGYTHLFTGETLLEAVDRARVVQAAFSSPQSIKTFQKISDNVTELSNDDLHVLVSSFGNDKPRILKFLGQHGYDNYGKKITQRK
jgi:hypothetical protein